MEKLKGNKLNVVFKNVWKDSSIHEQVLLFWESLNALPSQVNAKDRARQLVYVAINEGKVVAVTTAHEVNVKHLNNHIFFNFRVLIHPEFRIPGLVDKLCVLSRDFLQSLNKQGDSKAIGMITMAENKYLQQHRNEAVWPSSGFTFIGYSKAGKPIRICYFKGVEI